MTSLGIDVGSSSVKVSLLDIERNECVMSVTNPHVEMTIDALYPGWAEQEPELWWKYVCVGIRQISEAHPLKDLVSIGITYQMHGLVCLAQDGHPLRKSIIWCDSRAVEIGAEAFSALGKEYCLSHLLNSPGNFTMSKLAWVKRNEPHIYEQCYRFMLPGDYIAYRLSGLMSTSVGGLSEQMFWDFKYDKRADFLADYFGIDPDKSPLYTSSIGMQSYTSREVEELLGIPENTPITYRAGDQPNNAFSLNVLESGEVAATGGTSGVVYGVTDIPKADPFSRVNTFAHVNHRHDNPHYGILLCINGAGIMNSWLRKNMVQNTLNYEEMNLAAETVPAGSCGLLAVPFGNGSERVLENRTPGARIIGIDLNRHSTAHIIRAVQEGIAFSFRYGVDIMKGLGLKPDVIRAGNANLFLSPVFRQTLATLVGAKVELYNTDGALGAARGAAYGAGYYKTRGEVFSGLKRLECIEPEGKNLPVLEEAYLNWKNEVENTIKQ